MQSAGPVTCPIRPDTRRDEDLLKRCQSDVSVANGCTSILTQTVPSRRISADADGVGSQERPSGAGRGSSRTWALLTSPISIASETMSQLVVITGPIAAGKSSVALRLADQFRDAGRSAVVVDLDDTVAAVHAPPQDVERSWERARKVHGRLVGEWLSSGVGAVIVDGPFYTKGETSTMMAHVPNGVRARRVLLLASFEVTLDRVALDASRGVSKIPSVLRRLYEEFARDLPSIDPCEWTFDTSMCTLDEIVNTVSHGLLAS